MATRFEIALHGEDSIRLRAAAEEALSEIEQLEERLSLYRSTSEVSRVNALAAREAVPVSSDLFRLLSQAARLTAASAGAFDITIGPLMRCWGFLNGLGTLPDTASLAAARECVGMQWVELNESARSVRFTRPGLMIDLGAIGKGYAIDLAVSRLREAGVTSALIHGGTSTVFGIGHPPEAEAWQVAVELPSRSAHTASRILAIVPLRENSLSVSAVWGKSFRSGDRECGHVMDPRTGQPVHHTQLAAVILPSAAESDAFSTALLALGSGGSTTLIHHRPEIRGLVVAEGTGEAVAVRSLGGLVLHSHV